MPSRCTECGTAKPRYEDPRPHNYDDGVCLCAGCFRNAAEEQIEECQETINQLTVQIARIGKKGAFNSLPKPPEPDNQPKPRSRDLIREVIRRVRSGTCAQPVMPRKGSWPPKKR